MFEIQLQNNLVGFVYMPLTSEIKKTIETSLRNYCCLDNAGILDEDIRELCFLLGKKTYISNLSLAQNNIGDKEIRTLVNYLPPSIQELNLARNRISDEGAILLIRDQNLKTLVLLDNDAIGKETGEVIINEATQFFINLERTPL